MDQLPNELTLYILDHPAILPIARMVCHHWRELTDDLPKVRGFLVYAVAENYQQLVLYLLRGMIKFGSDKQINYQTLIGRIWKHENPPQNIDPQLNTHINLIHAFVNTIVARDEHWIKKFRKLFQEAELRAIYKTNDNVYHDGLRLVALYALRENNKKIFKWFYQRRLADVGLLREMFRWRRDWILFNTSADQNTPENSTARGIISAIIFNDVSFASVYINIIYVYEIKHEMLVEFACYFDRTEILQLLLEKTKKPLTYLQKMYLTLGKQKYEEAKRILENCNVRARRKLMDGLGIKLDDSNLRALESGLYYGRVYYTIDPEAIIKEYISKLYTYDVSIYDPKKF